MSYPISQGKIINFIAFVTIPGGEGQAVTGPTVVDVTKEEMTAYFDGWDEESQNLLDVGLRVLSYRVNVLICKSAVTSRHDGRSVIFATFPIMSQTETGLRY